MAPHGAFAKLNPDYDHHRTNHCQWIISRGSVGQRFLPASDREIARQCVQNNLVIPFTRQVNGNQKGSSAHRLRFYSRNHPLTTASIADIGFNTTGYGNECPIVRILFRIRVTPHG